ncbi:hypothetical protein CC1G_13559 [Coprinopsis cinerea okayama7|uniref:Uncharacterized protein n=1 Tax=Coprinopsis cinerea (strain Okayama-7 / 130 / ATCC MYA-4618 / FGSC 9003) TaxID=240176 RepID=D6RK28_COPC7|nr:hypothetical protein CC1G_13559 [Coprinopsis cinerea okayama7\|eukprot:XP_002912031.1 hypothetical protein CC1G_13559 [Coprinopsis cinerea okayama7\
MHIHSLLFALFWAGSSLASPTPQPNDVGPTRIEIAYSYVPLNSSRVYLDTLHGDDDTDVTLFPRATCGGSGGINTGDAANLANGLHSDPSTINIQRDTIVIVSSGSARLCVHGYSGGDTTFRRSTVGWAARQIINACCNSGGGCGGGTEYGTPVGGSSASTQVRLISSGEAC